MMGGYAKMQKMLKQMQKMQEEIEKVQEAVKERTVEATSGGGAVRVVVTGGLEVKEIRIDPSAMDPEDPELLADMLVAAVNEALREAQELASQELKKVTGLNFPGML